MKLRTCEGCLELLPRKEVQPVATLDQGLLMLCKLCAKADREYATLKLAAERS